MLRFTSCSALLLMLLSACGGGENNTNINGQPNNTNAQPNNTNAPPNNTNAQPNNTNAPPNNPEPTNTPTGPNFAQGEGAGPEYTASWAAASVLAECREIIPDAEILRVYSQWSAGRDGTTGIDDHWEVYMTSPSDPSMVCGGLVRHESRDHEPAMMVNYAPGYTWEAGEVVTSWHVDSPRIGSSSWFDDGAFEGDFFFDLRPAAHHRQTGAFVPEEYGGETPVVRVAPSPGSASYYMIHGVTGEVLHPTEL